MTKYICTKDFRSIKQGDIVLVEGIHIGWTTQIHIEFNRRTHITYEQELQAHFKIMEGE